MLRRLAMPTFPVFFSVAFATALLGADRPLRFAYSAIDTSFLPAWVAKEAGFFAKNKLPVELISLRSSPLCISAHIADEIDVCAGATSPVIAANLQGTSRACPVWHPEQKGRVLDLQ